MTAPTAEHHQVLLHGREHGPAPHIASFVSVALLRGEAAVLIAAPRTLADATDALAAAGIDVDAARAQGRYVELDAAATLDALRDEAGVHADRFHALVAPLLADLTARFGAVAAYGEMVGQLAAAGDLVGALALEELWGPVVRSTPLRLLCGYPHDMLDGHGGAGRVHDLHDTTVDPVDATWALDLPADARAAPLARGAVSELWSRFGLDGTGWAHDAELVVAELVGNAVRYGGSRPTLSVDVRRAEVTLSVTDASDELPARRGELLAENGRGYVIIDALAEAWGVERLPFGKRVWARLPRP